MSKLRLNFLRSGNPHVAQIHVPAHAMGALALALAAYAPSWQMLASFMIFNMWISGLGMSIGFHRYFTHRSFVTNRFWRTVMLMGGTLAGQGSVVFWTALHRLHHPNSDKTGDLHTPRKGFWYAYVGWIYALDPAAVSMSRAADIIRDPQCRWTHRNYRYILWTWWTLLMTACFFEMMRPWAVGAMIAGMWAIHQEALINSVCHDPRFGTATHKICDDSRDVHGLHYLTWGQSLHNTHHAHPSQSNFSSHGSDIGHRIIRAISSA